jgi:hypothetical protein
MRNIGFTSPQLNQGFGVVLVATALVVGLFAGVLIGVLI